MTSEEETLLDPKVDKRLALWISSIVALLFTFCVVDLQTNLGVGEKILVNFFGDELIKEMLVAPKFQKLPAIPSTDDKFEDLQSLFNEKAEKSYANFTSVVYESKIYENVKNMRRKLGYRKWDDPTPLDLFQMGITLREMYPENNTYVQDVLDGLVNDKIIYASERDGGTQFKMILTFENGEKAHSKPWRMDINQETNPNHFYFNDFERHNAEIAAYHIDKVLGFRRSIPHVGRVINITSELYPVASESIYDTFYVSPDNNVCFHGHCEYYCDGNHPICGNPDTIEISMGAHLPQYEKTERRIWRNPWRRSYSKRRRVQWQDDEDFCEIIKGIYPYNLTTRMLDMMDLHIFDFLIGNQDRHHYETFKIFGNETFPIFIDHGRTFGYPYFDDLAILVPIDTCCMIRESTLETLLRFHNGNKKLSEAFVESSKKDPIFPLLSDANLKALDRRVPIILQSVRNCLRKVDFKAKNDAN